MSKPATKKVYVGLDSLDASSGRVLPDDILKAVFHLLDVQTLVHSALVCKYWKPIVENELYRYQFLKRYISFPRPATGAAAENVNWKDLYQKYFLIHLNTDWKPIMSYSEPADNKPQYMPLPGVPEQPSPQAAALPADFEWFEMTSDELNTADPNSTDDMFQHVFAFLDQNTVEDEDGVFRVHHSKYQLRRLLLSALGSPAHIFLGVRVRSSKRVCGFIAATPTIMRAYSKTFEAYTVQMLTVHKKLRGKKLAMLIVRELARRIQIRAPHVQQAVFALGVDMAFNRVSEAKIWHRPLNSRKLINLQYLLATEAESQLPRTEKSKDLVQLASADMEAAWRLVGSYLQRFPIGPTITLAEFGNKYFPKDKEVYSYIVKGPNGEVTDFVTFFVLRQRALNSGPNEVVTSAFVEFCIAPTPERRKKILEDVLIVAKQEGLDQVQCIDIMDHSEFLDPLGFHQGSGRMVYYMHNWVVGGEIDRKSWANTLL